MAAKSLESDEADDASGMPSRSAENGQFQDVGELSDVQEEFNTESKHTLAVVATSVNVLSDFCIKSANTNLAAVEQMAPAELCEFLRSFYSGVRQKDGSLYARRSMLTLRYGLQRHFQRLLLVDITNDFIFKAANDVFNSVLSNLRSSTKLNMSHVGKKNMAKIRASPATSRSSPRGLQNTVFLDLMLHLCRSTYGRCNLRGMKKSHFSITTDPLSKRRFVSFSNKVKRSALDRRCRDDLFKGDDCYGFDKNRMYDTPQRPGSCPVACFEKYISKLHPMCDDFWQRPKKNFTFLPSDPHWYDAFPLGKNTLGNKMRDISAEAGCSIVYSNNCLKATGTRMNNSGCKEMSDNSEVQTSSSNDEGLSSDCDEQMQNTSLGHGQDQVDQLFMDDGDMSHHDMGAVFSVKSEDQEEDYLFQQHPIGQSSSPTVVALSVSSLTDPEDMNMRPPPDYDDTDRGSYRHQRTETCPCGIDQNLWTVERSWLDENNQRKWLLTRKESPSSAPQNAWRDNADQHTPRNATLRNRVLQNGHGQDTCTSPDLPIQDFGRPSCPVSLSGCPSCQCCHMRGRPVLSQGIASPIGVSGGMGSTPGGSCGIRTAADEQLLQLQMKVLMMQQENLALERRKMEAEVAKLEAERLKLEAERRKFAIEGSKLQREMK